MRAFISINLPGNIKKEISKIQENLPKFNGKKTEEENLHLTLKFLGQIDDEMAKKVCDKLRKIKLQTFEAKIGEIGIFSPSFIKIIWLSFSNCEKLQKEIDFVLKDLFRPEERFMGHLTIARVKNIKDKKGFLDEISKIKTSPKSFMIDKFYLMQSKLGEKGPTYSIVEEFNLG